MMSWNSCVLISCSVYFLHVVGLNMGYDH